LNERGADTPLLFLELMPPKGIFQAGFYAIDLADYQIQLKENAEYEWFIAIVPDPTQRAGDMIGSATVQYVKTNFPTDTSHYQYANQGFWYDAAYALAQQFQHMPDNPSLRQQRAALSEQVKMSKLAAFDNNASE